MGFTAAVSHELRTPLARLLALLENATLPGSDVDALMEQAMQEVHQTRELIDDVLFLGELETGREVVALGHTAAKPVVDEIVDSLADRADHAGVTLVVDGDVDVELPLRPRMLRVVVENLLANSIRYAGQGRTCTIELTNAASGPASRSPTTAAASRRPTCRASSSASTAATRPARAAAPGSASRSSSTSSPRQAAKS